MSWLTPPEMRAGNRAERVALRDAAFAALHQDLWKHGGHPCECVFDRIAVPRLSSDGSGEWRLPRESVRREFDRTIQNLVSVFEDDFAEKKPALREWLAARAAERVDLVDAYSALFRNPPPTLRVLVSNRLPFAVFASWATHDRDSSGKPVLIHDGKLRTLADRARWRQHLLATRTHVIAAPPNAVRRVWMDALDVPRLVHPRLTSLRPRSSGWRIDVLVAETIAVGDGGVGTLHVEMPITVLSPGSRHEWACWLNVELKPARGGTAATILVEERQVDRETDRVARRHALQDALDDVFAEASRAVTMQADVPERSLPRQAESAARFGQPHPVVAVRRSI